jgi:hypothetical protein
LRGVLEQSVELGALVTALGAADTVVDVMLDDPPALALSDLTQGLDLVLRLWPLRVETREYRAARRDLVARRRRRG